MRIVIAACVVVLGLAAVLVPLPWVVSAPATLVPMDNVATATVSSEHLKGAGTTLEPIRGTYLGVVGNVRAATVDVIAAAVRGDRTLNRGRRLPNAVHQQPAVVAALVGLGLSPARMEGADLPVEVEVDDGAATSLAAMLQLFDAMSPADVAAGRRIVGLGEMTPDQELRCEAPVQPGVVAAAQQDVDVVVVPAACAAGVAGSGVQVIEASSLVEAVEALLASAAG